MSGRRGQRKKTTQITRRKVRDDATPQPIRYDDDPRVLAHGAQEQPTASPRRTRGSARLKAEKVSLLLSCNGYFSPLLKSKNLAGEVNATVVPTEAPAHSTNDNSDPMDFELLHPNSTDIASGPEATNNATAPVATVPVASETEAEVCLISNHNNHYH
jgi:hypothetical protein